jgi:integrase
VGKKIKCTSYDHGLFKRGKRGIWYFTFQFNGQTIYQSSRSTSKTIADAAMRERRRELERGINHVVKRERVPLFRLAANEWLKGKVVASAPATAALYNHFVRSLSEQFGDRLISDIDHSDVIGLQRKRLQEGKNPRTVNLEISTLRQILRAHGLWAGIGDHIRHLRERQDIGRAIPHNEETRLLDAIRQSRSPALLPMFILAVDTGLRADELRHLRHRDLNLNWNNGTIERGLLTVSKSKTECGTGRTVPFTRRACAVLTLWLSRFPRTELEDYVFPAYRVGLCGNGRAPHAYGFEQSQPIGEWKKAWNDVCQKAGVKYRWHDLRHTFISRIAENPAVSEQTIMALAGHVSKAMLARYSHIRQAAKQTAIAGLEASLLRAEAAGIEAD